MASVRDSAEVKLVGFEQGINIKTNEQLATQTRARFQPLANSNVVITSENEKKASVTLRIKNIPDDPGDGNYTLHIESHKGPAYDLKIRVVGKLKAAAVLTVNNSLNKTLYDQGSGGALHNKAFTLSGFNSTSGIFNTVTFTLDMSSTRIVRNSSTSWTIGLSGLTPVTNDAEVRTSVAKQIYEAIFQVNLDEDLLITPVHDAQTVKLTQNVSGVYGNVSTVATSTLTTINNGNVPHGMTAGEKITIIDASGHIVDYFVSDTNDGGVAHLSEVTQGATLKNNGSDPATLADLTNLSKGIAVGFNLSSSLTRNAFLSLLKGAIEHLNGHNGTILVSANQSDQTTPQSRTLTQTVVGSRGNTTVTNNITNIRKVDFAGGTTNVSKPTGTALSSYITISDFVGGRDGLLRNLNVGNYKHPKDANSYALGLLDTPGYYPNEKEVGVAKPYTDTFNSSLQKIKRITFDINKIINYNTPSSGISSKIMYDDTLLIVQQTGASPTSNAIGKKIKQVGLDNSGLYEYAFGLENWKLVAKPTGDFVFQDLNTDSKKFSRIVRECNIPIFLPTLSRHPGSVSIQREILTIEYTTLDNRIPLATSQNDGVTRVYFYIVNELDSGSPYKIVNTSIENEIKVYINPYINAIGLKPVRYRQQQFILRLEEAIKEINDILPISLSVDPVNLHQNQYNLKIVERSIPLTYFKASFKNAVIEDTSDYFIQASPQLKQLISKDDGLVIYDGKNDTKTLRLLFDRATYGSLRKNDSFDQKQRAQYGQSRYVVGLKTPQLYNPKRDRSNDIIDLKNKIFDAIYFAKQNSDVDITPSMHNAYATIKVSKGNDLVNGIYTSRTDRIEIKSTDGVTKIYTVVDGGSGNPDVAKTGTILKVGDWYSSSGQIVENATLTITNGSAQHGMAAGQKITITAAQGLKIDYFVSDTNDSGAAHLSVVEAGDTLKANSGSPITATLTSGATGIAVGFNHSSTTQNTFLVLLKAAIEHSNGHAGKITVSSVPAQAGGQQNITIIQDVTNISGNEVINENIANLASTNFKPSEIDADVIGTVAVNIKSHYTKRDVLNELITAINHKNGHNKGVDDSVISVYGIDEASADPQFITLKQAKGGSNGNNAIEKINFSMLTITGFENADDYLSGKTIRLKTSADNGTPRINMHLSSLNRDVNQQNYDWNNNVYELDDFSTPVVSVEFKESTSIPYFTVPNHDLEIRSFGFNQKTSDLKFYEDLSLNGPRLDDKAKYKRTLDIDPVFFLTASPEVRFPIQVNNLGSILGSEYDGIIEPIEIRDLMLGRLIAEKPLKGLKGAVVGEYSFSSIRNESSLIHNRITFEEAKNVAFFDNSPTISSFVRQNGDSIIIHYDDAISSMRNNPFYSKVPGVIFKNEAKIYPYIDTEERIFQANPLNGNNPETNETDMLVLQVQDLNHVDDENLGGENFRRRAGYDFSSSPHPGTDSIVFGGLRYV